MLVSYLGLSITDTSILALLKKDVCWEVLDVQSAPRTALHAVSKWPWTHVHKANSTLSAWYVQEMGHVSLASRLKFTWGEKEQVSVCSAGV